jgi:hypothetical protein
MGQQSFEKALKMSDINFELTGVYGKRTKYQHNDIAQLLLKVNKKTQEESSSTSSKTEFPKWKHSNHDLDLNLLPKVIF